MRYIKKGVSPSVFEECKKSLPVGAVWDDFEENKELGQCKQDFKSHLMSEQSTLCVYCERKIHLDIETKDENGVTLSFQKSNCHFEHVMPKDSYPELAFEYKNLTLSCNGDQCDPEQKKSFKPEDVHSCGHKKGKIFHQNEFLNPVELQDISEFFVYDLTTCAIISSGKDDVCANKTIGLLSLNNPRLNNERSIARTEFIRKFSVDVRNKEVRRIKAYLGKSPAFLSFLRYWLASSNKGLDL
ncbi:MAG: TIGR02646 family protein [Thiothrix lacustris]|uniref:TIGR02646 family protein n=1 Tax=Thiothrix lacustris TaxID=525917 RepID=A0A1Y1QUM9_9GAMM|nr:MAG: TIGR02646 family protein [Thiothrix lacustris]